MRLHIKYYTVCGVICKHKNKRALRLKEEHWRDGKQIRNSFNRRCGGGAALGGLRPQAGRSPARPGLSRAQEPRPRLSAC